MLQPIESRASQNVMRKGKVKLPPSESEDAIGVAHESENGIALSVMRRPTEKYIRHY
jgi:hypothetical protein